MNVIDRSLAALTTRRFLVLLLVAIAARALSFGNPLVTTDEQFYFVVAHQMWHGAIPFVDIWDRKPVGLFLLYMPAAALPLPWGTLAYQLMALVCVVATAMIVARLAKLAGWERGATAGGIAYILWLNPLGGVGGQTPVFYNAGMALAALLIVTGGARRTRGIAAMALVGVVLQIKYSAVFEGIGFGLILLARDWRAARSLPGLAGYAAALVAVALVPTALALGIYAAMGQTDVFLFANFLSILERNPDPLAESMGNAGTLILILSPLIVMACAARGRAVGGDRSARRFLAIWLAVAVFAVAITGSWFDHYGLPIALPAAICAAGFLGDRGRARWVTPAILGIAGVIGVAVTAMNRIDRGDGGSLAALSQAVGKGPGCLFVYWGPTMLYPVTDRCAASRYVFPSHLSRQREQGSIGVDQATEVRRILRTRLAVIVMSPPYRGERADIRAIVIKAVARDYRLTAVTKMGRKPISIYHRVAGR